MSIDQILAGLSRSQVSGQELWAVHYACEDLFSVKDRPPGVSCVCFREIYSSQEVSFSVIDQYDDSAEQQECAMLVAVFEFLSKQRDAVLLHWNMNRADYGFRALVSRLRFLRRTDFEFQPPKDRTHDVDELIGLRYGHDYVKHPKLKNLADLNQFQFQSFLDGKELADRFTRGEHGELRRATQDKAKAIAFLAKRTLDGTLVTQTSGALLSFAGAHLDATRTVTALAERIVPVQRQLLHRHGQRPTLKVADEYDYQDLFHALLRVFFDDVRPEEWSPTYAGGASRIDFLLPDSRMAIELKHTRASMTAKQLGEQLIVDIAKYSKHPEVQRLVCLVLDLDGLLPNPRGIEKDLVNNQSYPVAVRIYDR